VKWSFILDITDVKDEDIKRLVEEKAEEVVSSLGRAEEDSVFRVIITFYQRRDRWLSSKPQIPREDWGRDLDNLISPVFDGLGPIIGYRAKWKKTKEGKWVKVGRGSARDSRIVEVIAKKVNSGSDREFLCVEVETLPL